MNVAQRLAGQVLSDSPADRQVSGTVTVRGAVTLLALWLATISLRKQSGRRWL